jgi:hypothetical protein
MFAAVGCSSLSHDRSAAPASAQEQQEAIARIQNNPNMPPHAKSAAIAMMKNPPGASQRPRSAQH